MQARELIMDLTNEQGKGRESQVQPPAEVWEQFFGVRINSKIRPTLRLQNMAKKRADPEQRKVVQHHHNLTIEIADAKPPRPAILRMQRDGVNSFAYWVYRARAQQYRHCDWLLANVAEAPTKERRWIII